MSGQLTLKSLGVAVSGLLIGGLLMWSADESHAPENSRGIASTSFPAYRGKSLAALQVSLSAPNGIPSSESEDVVLIGQVRPYQNFEGPLSYAWEIPEGVQVVEGDAEGSWASAPKGKDLEVRIVLRGFSQESLRMVSLHASTESEGVRYANTSLLTSRPQDSFEIVSGDAAPAEEGASQKMRAASRKPSSYLEGKIIR